MQGEWREAHLPLKKQMCKSDKWIAHREWIKSKRNYWKDSYLEVLAASQVLERRILVYDYA